MSGAVVVTPSTGAAWATAWEQFEGIRKGQIALSLTNYDATTVPQIASGSWIEVAGSIYKWTGNDSITGSLTSNAINYVTMVPSGSGASAILTPTWSDSAPTWSDAYQGWFSGTTRYAAGCYYDGTNYPLKWIYTNRHAGAYTRHIHLPFAGHTEDLTNITLEGGFMNAVTPGGTDEAFFAVYFPPHSRCLVTELATYCSNYSDGTHTFTLFHSPQNSSSETSMATTSHTGTGEQTDTTITDPVIDNETYQYFIEYDPGTDGTATMSSMRIEYIEIVRC